MPEYFKHKINTGVYENKICPLGNTAGYLLAEKDSFKREFFISNEGQKLSYKQEKISKLNKILFITVAILAFINNLNAFIYLIPVFIFEIFLQNGFCRRVRFE